MNVSDLLEPCCCTVLTSIGTDPIFVSLSVTTHTLLTFLSVFLSPHTHSLHFCQSFCHHTHTPYIFVSLTVTTHTLLTFLSVFLSPHTHSLHFCQSFCHHTHTPYIFVSLSVTTHTHTLLTKSRYFCGPLPLNHPNSWTSKAHFMVTSKMQ